MALIRNVQRQLKISRLIKVIYRIARNVDFNIYAYVEFIFSDGTIISEKDWTFKDELDVQKYGRKGFLLYIDFVKIYFSSQSPTFEYLDCVTQ